MGMDLIPKNNIEGFHANWNGWSTIQVLLDLLKCNLKDMDGANDGHLVPAGTARAWGKAVEKALKKGLLAARIRDDTYSGGVKEWAIPASKKRTFEKSLRWVEQGNPARNILEVYLMMSKGFAGRPAVKQLELWKEEKEETLFLGYSKVDKEWVRFIRDFARFAIRSGGFEQC